MSKEKVILTDGELKERIPAWKAWLIYLATATVAAFIAFYPFK